MYTHTLEETIGGHLLGEKVGLHGFALLRPQHLNLPHPPSVDTLSSRARTVNYIVLRYHAW